MFIDASQTSCDEVREEKGAVALHVNWFLHFAKRAIPFAAKPQTHTNNLSAPPTPSKHLHHASTSTKPRKDQPIITVNSKS